MTLQVVRLYGEVLIIRKIVCERLGENAEGRLWLHKIDKYIFSVDIYEKLFHFSVMS